VSAVCQVDSSELQISSDFVVCLEELSDYDLLI